MTTRHIMTGVAAWFLAAAVHGGDTYELKEFQPQNPKVDSVRFALMGLRDVKFYSRGDRYKVNVLTNEPDTAFTYRIWMQKQPAPLVMLIPGLGGHCASLAPTVLAESLFGHGLSVMVVGNPFNWDFVLNGSTVVTPGYTPQDARDLYEALQVAVADVGRRYGKDKVTRHLLVGYSLGGLEALFMADLDGWEQKFKFERVLAINPPVNLLYGLKMLDDGYARWTNWTQIELESKKNRAVDFYDKHMRTPRDPDVEIPGTNAVLPFTGDEAELAVGMVFHRSLGEVIKAVHRKRNFGVLAEPYKETRTRFLEKEIERYGYANYIMTFVKAAYSNLWTGEFTSKDLNKRASMPALAQFLASNDAIRIIHTRDDFLVTDYDRDWLARVLSNRVAFLDHGSHLGYLYRADALEFIAWQLGYGTNPLAKVTASALNASAATGTPVVATGSTTTVAATSTTSTGTVASAAVAPTGTAASVSATVVSPGPPPKAETVATVEMADECLTTTATVVNTTGTTNTQATLEYMDTMVGVVSNPSRPDITIEFQGD